RRLAGELAHELALLHEVVQQLLAHLQLRILEDVEELDGDRLVPDEVLGLVNRAETALSGDADDPVLLGNGRADDTERVVCVGHRASRKSIAVPRAERPIPFRAETGP